MILLALDEQGDFEYIRKDEKKPIFIGGVLFYDGDDEDELASERVRIRAYYEAVCKKYSTETTELSFPKSLHVQEGVADAEVALMKNGVTETIKEFLSEGTFDGKVLSEKERKGTYYPYIYLKSDLDKKEFFKKTPLMNDKEASTLYYHMVHDVLERLVCQNGIEQNGQAFSIELATRSTPAIARNDARYQDYQKAGYRVLLKKKEKDGTESDLTVKTNDKDVLAFRVQLTNQDVYRTTLRELMLKNRMYNAEMDLKVKSINYYSRKSANNQEFLYLADSVCAIFGFGISGDTADEWLNQIRQKADKVISEERCLIYGYDIVDDDYKKVYDAIDRQDFYSAMEELYILNERTGGFANYYKKRWVPYLLQRMYQSLTPNSFEKAVSELAKTLRSNSYSQKKGLFITEELIKIVHLMEQNQNTKEYGRVFFMLYSAAVSAYSHSGAPDRATEAYHKALRYSIYAPVDDFLALRSKMIVVLTDSFDLGKALEMAEENIKYQTNMGQLRESVLEIHAAENYIETAKAYSQLGQVYAYMRDDKAIDYFKKALLSMSKKSANYYITESYLLHYYLEMGMREEYRRKAKEYFGGKEELDEQLYYIIQEGKKEDSKFNSRFALYVFVRSLWVFFRDNISDDLIKQLKEIHNMFKLEDHPTELIAKYMILILRHYGEDDSVYLQALKMFERIYRTRNILLFCIVRFVKIELAIFENRREDAETAMMKLVEMMHEQLGVFSQEDKEKDPQELWEMLSEKFTYMYH